MEVGNPNLITISIVVGVVLSLTVPTQPQTSADEFPMQVESGNKDFIVKFKGEIFSWKNLSQLLRQHNITVPLEQDVFDAVLAEVKFPAQACKDRCFLDERKACFCNDMGCFCQTDKPTCFCDTLCKAFGDCCLDFYSRCNQTSDDVSLQDVECGNVDEHSWSGVIMKSSCISHGHQSTNDCQTVERLNMTLQKELPVFDSAQNITYRSIGCATCNSGGNLSFWGLDISCEQSKGSISTPVNIAAIQRFLKEHPDCSWKYAPLNLNQRYRSCVLQDTRCSSTQLPVMSVVRELCYSYSMVITVFRDIGWHGVEFLTYRNPHCALCNLEGKSTKALFHFLPFRPLSILLDVSTHILSGSQHLTSQLLNCNSIINNCTVISGGQICKLSNSSKGQSASRLILMRKRQISFDNDVTNLKGNKIFILCPENQASQANKGSTFLTYTTLVGTILSIISLCFLLNVYLSFKDPSGNLPDKCLINLFLALLCYQTLFLGVAKLTEVEPLCKVVAIFLHFFILAEFSWMSIMAFDTANSLKVQVRIAWRQPLDTGKTFIKYCIVGWGMPVVVAVLCSVLEFTGTIHFGYGNSINCWMSNKTAVAVTMVTPLSFSLIFNVACLLKNARAIRRLQQGASLTTNNSSHQSLTLICIKLTTVMGLTWILGLTSHTKQTTFLQHLSTVLNSMQGIFVALCFTTTKKVRSLLKERFCNRGIGAVEPQADITGDPCAGNSNIAAPTGSGLDTFEMKCLSIEQAIQNSS